MVTAETIATIVIKIAKLVLNIFVLILYRFGYGGDFLGVGGTWNMNEEMSQTAEIIASGVIVGYLIYSSCHIFGYLFGPSKHKRELSDTIMVVFGFLLWTGVAGTSLHYWHGYPREFDEYAPHVVLGLLMSYMMVVVAILYLVDAILAFMHYAKNENSKY